MNNAQHSRTKFCVWTYVFIPLGLIARSRKGRVCGNSIFEDLRNFQTLLQRGCPIIHSHLQNPHPQQHPPLSIFFIILFLVGGKWYLTAVLICIFLMVSDVEHAFMCLLSICTSPLENYLSRSFVHFFNWVVFLLSRFYFLKRFQVHRAESTEISHIFFVPLTYNISRMVQLQLMSIRGHIILPQSPQFTFTFGVVYSMHFDKCRMICIYHYIIQKQFHDPKNSLCSTYSSLCPH